MKKQPVTLQIISILALLVVVFLSCTTNAPTEPSVSGGKGVKITLSNKSDSASYIGHDLSLEITFDDSIVANFSNAIAVESFGAKFVSTEEMIKLQKVKKLTLPLYWNSYAQLKKDTLGENQVYVDSIYVSIFDALNNETGRSNVVRAYVKNIPPAISKFTAAESTYVVPNHITDVLTYSYYLAPTSDSVRMYTQATDIDPQNISITWSILTNNTSQQEADKLISWNSTSPYATYFVRNSSNIRDYISCIVSDGSRQIPITLKIIRSDGFDTKVDSIQFADTTFKGSSVNFVYKSVTLDSASVWAFPHSEGGIPKWTANNGSIIIDSLKNSEGYAITYINNSDLKEDTLHTDTLIMLDTLKLNIVNSFGDDSTTTNIIIYKKPLNIAPVVDSILTDTLLQEPISGRVRFTVEAGTTIDLQAYAHDTEGGSVAYSWDNSSLEGTLSAVSGAAVTYTANDSMYYDTVVAIVTDSASFSDSVDIILLVDSRPIITGATVGDTTFSGAGLYKANITATDSISIKVNVTDADEGDSLTYLWDYMGAKIDSIYYITLDSTYDDTFTITATDMYGLEATKDIVISVVKP